MLFPDLLESLSPALTDVLLQLAFTFILMLVSYLFSYRVLGGILFNISTIAGIMRGRLVFRLFTLPGVIIHELSHAAGFLLTGYSVSRVSFGIKDLSRGGFCEPGRRFLPFTIPFIADIIISFAPLVAGSIILKYLLGWMNLNPGAIIPGGEGLQYFPVSLWNILSVLDYTSLRTYIFIFLAMSIGAELAPSRADLRDAVPNILWSLVILVSVSIVSRFSSGLTVLVDGFLIILEEAVYALNVLLGFGVLVTAVAIVFFGAISLFVNALKRK